MTMTALSNPYQQVQDALPFLNDLIRQGARIIEEIRSSGNIDAKVKGEFSTGELDYVTKADMAVRDFYAKSMQERLPEWCCLIEDGKETPAPDEKDKSILIFFDPLDGTQLFTENKPGYSTMAGVALRRDEFFQPVAGLIQIINGLYLSAYNGEERPAVVNFPLGTYRQPESLEACMVGRSSVNRSDLLDPAVKALGCQARFIRGIGPQTAAFIQGETDLCMYEPPGPSFWDLYPMIPIVEAVGGNIFDWHGDPIRYDGSKTRSGHGVIVVHSSMSPEIILERIKKVYP